MGTVGDESLEVFCDLVWLRVGKVQYLGRLWCWEMVGFFFGFKVMCVERCDDG
jgi:hypothetical protein